MGLFVGCVATYQLNATVSAPDGALASVITFPSAGTIRVTFTPTSEGSLTMTLQSLETAELPVILTATASTPSAFA